MAQDDFSRDPFDRVRDIALAMPGVEESTTFGTPSLKVNGKYLFQMKDNDTLIVSVDLDTREMLLATEPEIFFITEHFRGWPAVLVRLAETDDRTLRDIIEKAWRRRAPKKLVKAYDAR
ncbi:MAG: MmcQ/YjbR family DNA-binding protein [Chloroflexi bacterium]|nr:MmcQ/YjbR family DNA-binding protein [Chloroflexota bacterium]